MIEDGEATAPPRVAAGMRATTWPVSGLLFASGFCALVYQVAWLREFRLIFGASTAASAAVLAIFIGGLGVGGLLLGSRADRHPRPLLFYASLEMVVAVSAALSPLLLMASRTMYFASGGSSSLGTVAATIERLILSAVVLAVPTLAMGGTLPAAARAVTRRRDVRRQNLATLYAMNTLGAVAGCLIATFFLLELYGTRRTLWLAAAVNLMTAMSARAVDRSRGESLAPTVSPSVGGRIPRLWFLLLASGTVGFAFFLMELVWYRLLGPLLGGSVFTFGLVLAVALAGIGIGGLLYSLIASDRPASLRGFAASCLFEAAAVAATYALGDRVALLTLTLVPLGAAGFSGAIAGWTIVATIVILPPAIVAGYQFPMLIALFGQGRERVGRDVGLAYAANTIGAILGSLAGGFGALPWLSAPGVWRLVALVLVGLGIFATVLATVPVADAASVGTPAASGPPPAGPARLWRSLAIPTALVAMTLVLLLATGPTAVWRHSGIGANRVGTDVLNSPNRLHDWQQAQQRAIVWDGDGVESTVALSVVDEGYAFIVNGKSDGSARGDAATQVMVGLIGAMSHPQPRRALVIGLGTGSTAGWLGAVPSMERVEVVELESLVVDVARVSEAVNHDVMHNPKVRIRIGDARETLLTTPDRYDVIASEPSNPFRAGIASLFTLEYYQAARARLTEDGVFVQWVQAYEIDGRTLRTIYATLAAVFPQVETWQTNQGDLLLVAKVRPGGLTAAALCARIAEEPYKTALANVWRAVDVNGLLGHYLANDALTRALTGPLAEINTDDRNIVEFGLARTVGRAGSRMIAEIRDLAHAIGASRPVLDSDAAISWAAVDTAWASVAGWEVPPQQLHHSPAIEQQRQEALRRYYHAGDVAGAADLWRRQSEGPRDPTELAMAAALEAEIGSETALPLVERLRIYQPAEADTVLATLRLRQSRTDEAAAALASAFRRYRVDPWPLQHFERKALVLAVELTARDAKPARRLFDELQQPFAVHAVDTNRLVTMVDLAARFDFKGACRDPIGALEPHVPWTVWFLTQRRSCYLANNDARLTRATRDLNDFLAHEPLQLAPR